MTSARRDPGVLAPLAPEGRTVRRPSGEAPPLPLQLSRSTRGFVGAALLVVALWLALASEPGARIITALDVSVLQAVERLRTDALTSVMRGLHALGSLWVVRVIAWVTIAVVLLARRFQHAAAFLVVLLVMTYLEAAAALELGRMRPAEVTILGGWDGYSHPSRTVAGLALVLVGALYTLVPAGTRRNRAAWVVAASIGLLAIARTYLGVDHPTDVVAAVVSGVAVPVVVFRLFTPDEVYPVTYKRGGRAHLDVTGRRGDAIVAAVGRQLGLEVLDVEPFGLGSSAGSTPLRLTVRTAAGVEQVVFGKLYALSHLRSDRWYKLARTVRYGRLEDEKPFNTVRRLVEYEDHMLRLMQDVGLPTPEPLGIVEITPEREYMLVTEFLDGAERIDEAPVDGDVAEDALRTVRELWDAGIAHRDLKPANILVRDGQVLLIDVAFAAVRPTPWRQAVDLANMMLTLGLRCPPAEVYARALRWFTPDEVAEAFAASRGVTIPSQLRAMLRADGRDLRAIFRSFVPERRPVAIQRWGFRRVTLTMSVVAGAVAAVWLLFANLRIAGLL